MKFRANYIQKTFFNEKEDLSPPPLRAANQGF